MLEELRVSGLGVIADTTLQLGNGMTALTGETGAGKTLLVEALELLLGGRADATLVRPGNEEAIVEGIFAVGGSELVLARAVPSSGRSRAWVNARIAPVSALAEVTDGLVDLHGQHMHQSLLRRDAQRDALDAFAGLAEQIEAYAAARARVRSMEEKLAALGGDSQAREREADVLRYQLAEIDAAGLSDPEEVERLESEAEVLADASAHREAAAVALGMLVGDSSLAGVRASPARDLLGEAMAALGGRASFASTRSRLGAVAAEIDDVATELRSVVDALEEDPERLDEVRTRLQLIRELARKYGGTIADILSFASRASERLVELDGMAESALRLQGELSIASAECVAAGDALGCARRSAASRFASRVQEYLRTLAMPRAALEVRLSESGPGDDAGFLFTANPGEVPMPLAKVASGGELARVMLAIRLVASASGGPSTLVFDEVDAGIGGEAALAVGRALSALGRTHQVLVVTHLAQVAAYADHHALVSKQERSGRTEACASVVDGEERLVELSRMLSGQSGSRIAREHAKELLGMASSERAGAKSDSRVPLS